MYLENGKKLTVYAGGLVVAALLAGFYHFTARQDNASYPQMLRSVVLETPPKLTDIHLIDQNNQSFGVRQLEGKWTFMFFGYTHCPDVCPATLSQIALLQDQLGEKGYSASTQFVFVSVDPKRDGVKTLAEYAGYFGESIMAATGTLADITHLEHQVGVWHRYGKADSKGDYTVTHSAEIFLIDPVVSVVAKFQPPIKVSRVASQYAKFVDMYPTSGVIN